MFDLSAALLLVPPLAVLCVTAIVLVAVFRRRGAVRGHLRAGPVQFGIDIDADPSGDGPGTRS